MTVLAGGRKRKRALSDRAVDLLVAVSATGVLVAVIIAVYALLTRALGE